MEVNNTRIESFKGFLAWVLPSYIFRWLYDIENIGPFHSTWFGVNKMKDTTPNTTPRTGTLTSDNEDIVDGR